MFNARHIKSDDQFLIIRAVHIVERSGLAMAGAMCGTFVAAELSKTEVRLFELARLHRGDGPDRRDRVLPLEVDISSARA